jgi:tetratricopeptide (TPR) repeat protein
LIRSLFVVALLAPMAVAAPAPPAAPPKGPKPEEIQKAIADLSSPRFAVREKASRVLWEAGAAAEPALRAAAKSADEETANRIKAILDKFDWGLYPDTPADVVKLIEKFRGGEAQARQEAVAELIRMKPPQFPTLRKLIGQEKDENARQEMSRLMAHQARTAVPSLIVAGQMYEAGELLEVVLSPANPASLTDYAAFHHLRKSVPEAIRRMDELRQKGSEGDQKRATEALVYLYRVQKDWANAGKLAAAAGNANLQDDVAWEAADWKALAEGFGPREVPQGDHRGAKAAYHRLAGNRAKFDELIADLRKDLGGVEGDDAAALDLATALLLNGEGAQAIDVLKDRHRRGTDLVFDLLCAQLKFKEAFAYADRAAKELEKHPDADFERDQLAIRRGRILYGLGDRDGATQILRGALDRMLTGGRDRSATEVVKAMAHAGMRDLAAESAARVLIHFEKLGHDADTSFLLEPVFGDKKHVVHVWWRAVRRDKPDADPAVSMTRVLELVDAKADRKKVDRIVELIQELRHAPKEDGGKPILPDVLTGYYGPLGDYAIAEAYRTVGVKDKAEEFFRKAIGGRPATEDLPFLPDFVDDEFPSVVPTAYKVVLAYADFLMQQKRHVDAAAQYRKAWELVPAQPLPLFLHGHARKQAGDAAEGERLMGLAHWVPLGNEVTRTKFSEDLSKRGFDADSRKEMDLVVNTGWFRTHYVGNVYLRLARIKARARDYATAAALYEKDVISLFRTGATFVDPRANLTVPELARAYRARALFAAGKVDEALAQARAGLAVLPGNVELAIDLVPDLDRGGRKSEADEIYGRVKAAYEGAIGEYGSSADLRNSLAWTMVNCNRDLDVALGHATKAVELTPRAAGYIDTLAEVHFRKKDRAKAVELMKRCLALEPANPYFRKQLERFETKPFNSPLPDEETGDE